MMWRTQDILHKKPQVVPGTLLAMAGSALVYHHMNSDVEIYQSDPIKTFLAMIIVQMLPLVALEMKIMSCADPVGLFCKFATPVTLIHVFFLAMRLVMYANYDSQTLSTSAVALVGAIVTIVKGYRQSWLNVIECGTVWGLITLAFLAALSTTSLDSYMKPEWQTPSWERFFSSAFETANAYIEIVAFVPAATDTLKALLLVMRATDAVSVICPSKATNPESVYILATVRKPKQFLLGNAAQFVSKMESDAPPKMSTGPL